MRRITGWENIEELCGDILHDESNLKGAFCTEVVWPETTREAAEYIAECSKNSIPVTFSGGRTGIVGGALPCGGAVISTEAMKKITLDDETITAQSGVTIEELRQFISKHIPGKFYPPDPTEEGAFIGGTVATDASGSDSFLYGSTRRWVEKLEMILPGGKILNLKRGEYRFDSSGICIHPYVGTLSLPQLTNPQPEKNTAGLRIQPEMDLIDLFIGSEGMLGLITEVGLILAPKPQYTIDLAVFPDDTDSFWKLFFELLGRKDELRLRALEMMDDRCLDFIRTHPGDMPPPPEDASNALLIRCEAFDDDELDENLMKLDGCLNSSEINPDSIWGGFEPAEHKRLRDFRHALPDSVNHLIAGLQSNFPEIRKFGSDGAVPPARLREYYLEIRKALDEKKLQFLIFGHAGDGHLHANVLPRNYEDIEKASIAMRKIAAVAVEMGGTLSAEHGLGRLKSDYLSIMYSGNELEGMEIIRRIIDPNCEFASALALLPGK